MTVNTNVAQAVEIAADGSAVVGSAFRPEGTAGAVWDALTANPGASVTEIAGAAGVSRPTATKALTVFAEAGRAVRTPGGRGDNGRPLPDTWAAASDPASEADAADAPQTTDASVGEVQDDEIPVEQVNSALSIEAAMKILAKEEERRAVAEAELSRAQAEEEYRRQKAAEALTKARTSEDTRQALADLLTVVTTTYAALAAGDDAAVSAGLEEVYGRAANVRKAAKGTGRASGTGGTAAWGSSRGDRSAPRPLRPEVMAHLAKFPDQVFTPGEIAKVLDRSSGAVANALDTLVKNGEAELVSERPNKYRLIPAKGTAGPDESASGQGR